MNVTKIKHVVLYCILYTYIYFDVYLGWIRYAEHMLGSLVTPHICTARSPQQIMGSLVKDYFSKQQVSLQMYYSLFVCIFNFYMYNLVIFHVQSLIRQYIIFFLNSKLLLTLFN